MIATGEGVSRSCADDDVDSLGRLLAWGRKCLGPHSRSPQVDAEVLLAACSERSRAMLYAFPERRIGRAASDAFEDAIARRAGGEPVAQILGRREFYSIELVINRDVLVPRPETELIVDAALEAGTSQRGLRALDLGTGSGAIAIALKHARPAIEVTGIDISAAALDVARSNAERLNLQIRWLESDWFDALRMERFDMLLCNPPYVRSEDSHMQSLRYEPGIALDGGSDGLAAIRRVMARARSCMTQDAVLIIEHGFDQSGAVAAIAADCGLTVSELRRDLAGLPRVSIMRARQ